MTNGPSSIDSENVAAQRWSPVSGERVRVRRRRKRRGHSSRAISIARGRVVQRAVVCAGTLLLMAGALYMCISRQSADPEGALFGAGMGARGAA